MLLADATRLTSYSFTFSFDQFMLSSSFLFLSFANGVVAQLLILVCGRGETVVAVGRDTVVAARPWWARLSPELYSVVWRWRTRLMMGEK